MNLYNYIYDILKSQELENQIPEILRFFKPLTLTENSFLVEKGKVCNYFCFIESVILLHAIEIPRNKKQSI